MKNERLLFEQTEFPVFQNRMYDSPEEARLCPRGDIRIVQNDRTGLIYNTLFRPELMAYDSAYQNEQAHSPSFQSHLQEVAGIVERALGTDELIEIGCGKGYFLELLQSRGCAVTGFDPTYEGNNKSVQRKYFDLELKVSAKGMVLRHVLEHIRDPVSFLEVLRKATLGENTLLYIEVPCFEWILRNHAWFDIFYEHVNYFRRDDFVRMFERVIEVGHIFNGQYLYVIADLSTLRAPIASDADRIDMPRNFFPDVIFDDIKRRSGPVTIWGAASKGVIYALICSRQGIPVKTIVDINPAKIGRFIPATGLRVVSPQEVLSEVAEGSEILVMNSNYSHEIRELTKNRFSLTGVESE